LKAEALSEKESDAVQMRFPVYEHGVEKFTALSGSFTGTGGQPAEGGSAEMRFTVPEDRHVDTATLTVSVNPTVAGALLESLPYLADYPYGCVEQTMSRFLPTVVVKKTLADLGFTLADLGVDPTREVPAGYWGRPEVQKLKVLREEDLKDALDKGLARLSDFQHGDGSFGWWKQSSADLRMTAKNDYRYLVFEDMKGAGFEPVQLLSGRAYSGILSYREFRDERVAFFCARLRQGEHKLTYRLKAEIPGDFHIMPARGQAMYLPEVRAISNELRISITEAGTR
jgi:uncharacterized protein YfaS (alpha-2-macroglobulin family)